MSFDSLTFEDIKTFLPKYLSEELQKKLFDEFTDPYSTTTVSLPDLLNNPYLSPRDTQPMPIRQYQATHEGLVTLFSTHDIERRYEALIVGKPKSISRKSQLLIY